MDGGAAHDAVSTWWALSVAAAVPLHVREPIDVPGAEPKAGACGTHRLATRRRSTVAYNVRVGSRLLRCSAALLCARHAAAGEVSLVARHGAQV